MLMTKKRRFALYLLAVGLMGVGASVFWEPEARARPSPPIPNMVVIGEESEIEATTQDTYLGSRVAATGSGAFVLEDLLGPGGTQVEWPLEGLDKNRLSDNRDIRIPTDGQTLRGHGTINCRVKVPADVPANLRHVHGHIEVAGACAQPVPDRFNQFHMQRDTIRSVPMELTLLGKEEAKLVAASQERDSAMYEQYLWGRSLRQIGKFVLLVAGLGVLTLLDRKRG